MVLHAFFHNGREPGRVERRSPGVAPAWPRPGGPAGGPAPGGGDPGPDGGDGGPGLGPAPAGALAAGRGAGALGRPGPPLVGGASGPVAAPDFFRASGYGSLPAGPAAGFSSRAPRQTASAPKPDHLRPSEPPRQAGRGTGPALHGGRRLAESLGLASVRPGTSWSWPRCRSPRRWAPAWW
jgi:hypothetical protein